MLDLALHIADVPASVALEPGAVELLSDGPQLHNQVAGQVLWLSLSPLLAPELDQGRFVTTHDDPGVRAADERTAIQNPGMVRFLRRHGCSQGQALTLGGVAETFVALNRGPRVWAMEIWSRGRR